MCRVAFIGTHNDGEAYLFDDIQTDNAVSQDGFYVALREVKGGYQAKTYIELGNGLVEPINPTDHIKQLVINQLGLSPENYQQGSSLNAKGKNAQFHYEREATPFEESGRGIKPNEKTMPSTLGAKPPEQPKPVKATNDTPNAPTPLRKPEKPKMSQEIQQVLQMNSQIIERLAEDLDIAQTKCQSLSALTGSNYRATRARKMLVEQGLIEKSGKGYVFTPMALELGLGTYTRKPDSEYQVLRYSPKILDYISPVQEKRKPVVPFTLLDPQGNRVVVENVKDFCAENGLITGHIYQLLSGLTKSHKSWTLPK